MPAALCLVPVVLTLLYVCRFGVDLPYMDDIETIAMLQKWYSGRLGWSDFWAQHNEHRILVPRILMLLIARISDVNLLWTMITSYLFLCGSLFIVYKLYCRATNGLRPSLFYFVPIPFLFLGWRQSEGLLWGFHLSNTMALFFSLFELYCLGSALTKRWAFVGSAASALLATYSAGLGLMTWPIGILYLAAVRDSRKSVPVSLRIGAALLWSACAVIAVAAFRIGYVHPLNPWPTGFGVILQGPGTAAHYALVAAGAPFAWGINAATFGGLMLLGFVVLLILLGGGSSLLSPARLPIVMMGMLPVLGTCGLLLNRLGLGVHQALAPRYVTTSNLLPIALYILLILLPREQTSARLSIAAFIIALSAGIFQSYSIGYRWGHEDAIRKSDCRTRLYDLERRPRKELGCMYPDENLAADLGRMMKIRRLNVFRRELSVSSGEKSLPR